MRLAGCGSGGVIPRVRFEQVFDRQRWGVWVVFLAVKGAGGQKLWEIGGLMGCGRFQIDY